MPVTFDVEALFAAEVQLRRAASEYSSVEHSQQSIACRRERAKELRLAARRYGDLSRAIEIVMSSHEHEDPDVINILARKAEK